MDQPGCGGKSRTGLEGKKKLPLRAALTAHGLWDKTSDRKNNGEPRCAEDPKEGGGRSASETSRSGGGRGLFPGEGFGCVRMSADEKKEGKSQVSGARGGGGRTSGGEGVRGGSLTTILKSFPLARERVREGEGRSKTSA